MTIEQQIRALMSVATEHGASYATETLERVVRFVMERSRDGYVDFSIENFAKEIMGDD